MTAYADYDDMIARFDARTIADMLGDNGRPADDPANSPTLATLLSEATGILNSAVKVGNMYTTDQIAELIAQADTGTEHLKGIVCRICWVLLLQRRPEKYKAAGKELEAINKEVLDPIRNGARLFDVEGRSTEAQTIEGDEITALDIQRSRPLTFRAREYYPRRESQLPTNRGV